MVQKKMSTHGAVNIPVQMRRSMGLQPKDVIELEEKDGALILRPREIRCAFCGTDEDVLKLKGKGSVSPALQKHRSGKEKKMKIDLKTQTSGQLVDALVELDKLRLQTARSIDMYKAELQARGVSIMDDRNQQYIRFYGDGGSASITDKQKLDLTNPDRLQKWLPEGVYKKTCQKLRKPSTS